VSVNRFRELDRPFPALKKVLEHLPALMLSELRQIVAIKIKQIEGIKDGLVRATGTIAADGFLERAEVGPALLVEHHSFAVEDQGAQTEGACRCGNRGKVACPIVPAPRDDADAVKLDVDLRADNRPI
jgi:hypothetical protein